MEVGISRGAPLLLNGGNGHGHGIIVKSKGIGNGNGVGPHPIRHRHHIDIKTEEPDSSVAFEEETTTVISVPTKQHLLNLNVTRCPICQNIVLDLPQHISLTHHQPRPASTMVLPTAAAAINLVKKEDNSGAPINLSVRNNNNDSINNNHSPPPRGVSPSSKSSPAAYLALNALAAAAANSNGLALIGSRVPSDDISSSGESSVGSGCRSPSSASMTPHQIATAAAAQLTAAAESVSAGDDDSPRKRRKQTHVPNESKDERYWTRRLKNNEAAKRSRDMRIKRERVVFEENQRLENMNKELRLEMDKFITENKELRLKMDIVMEDNGRLKNILASYQTADQERRRSMEQAEDARPGKPVLLLKEDV